MWLNFLDVFNSQDNIKFNRGSARIKRQVVPNENIVEVAIVADLRAYEL